MAAVAALFLCALAFLSCDMFNKPLQDFLDEWTNVAKIMEHRFDGSYPATGGLTNLPSGGDRVITYYLVNPQNYLLDPSATFASSPSPNQGLDYSIGQDASDRTVLRLTLNNTYLQSLDGTGTEISPTVSITEPKSGRNFGSYTVPLRVNSAPPAVSSPIILYNDTDNTYVICFNMPDMNTNSSIHRDIVSLTVSGFYDKTYTVTAPSDSNGNGITGVTNAYDDTNYKEVSGGGAFFGDKNNRFVGIETGVSLTAVPSPECTITLTDSSGLTSVVTASTEAPPLPAVTANPGSGTIEPGDLVTFNHATAGSTVTLTLSSTEGVTSSAGPFTENTVTFTGGGSGISLTFVKKGTYTVTATAGGVSGARDTTTTFTYTVPYSAVYISQNGSDSNGTGTPINPFATLDKAIETIDGEGVVYVTGNVAVTSEHNHSSGSLTLRGYNGGGTLKNDSGRVLNITGGSVTLGEGITLTGHINYANARGGAVHVTGGKFTMESGSTIADSIVEGTSASGGGVSVGSGGTFTMNDGAKIIRCQAWDGGGAVYVSGDGANFTMNGGVIGGDSAYTNVAKWGGGVYVGFYCEFTMSGNSEISYNMAENTGSNSTGIHGGGVCFSAIFDSTFTMNDNAKIIYNTCDGSGGGVYVGNSESRFFMNDNARIKYNEAYNGGGVYFTGDGTFTVSGRPDITENILDDSSTNNVTLADGKVITIGGTLSDAARIGVNTEVTPDATGIMVTDKSVDNAGTIFSSDKGYYVDNKADGVWLRDIEVTYQVGNGPKEGTFAEALTELDNESSGGVITLLKDISLTQTAIITGGSHLLLDKDTGEGGTPVTIDLNGHTLSGNGSASVLSVSVGMLEIKDSSANPDGTGGTGKITGGGGSSGGGINVDTNGALRLVSGSITDNGAINGGGVYVSNGIFTMRGGSITDNGATKGGGVYVSKYGIFTMRGGSISGNGKGETELGAGVCDYGEFTMTGGSITGNILKIYGSNGFGTGGSGEGVYGGGVYVASGAVFSVGGSPIINGNKQDGNLTNQNDVCLDSDSAGAGAKISIRSDLDRTGKRMIGIYMKDPEKEYTITSGWNNSSVGELFFGNYAAGDTGSIQGYSHTISVKDNEIVVEKNMTY